MWRSRCRDWAADTSSSASTRSEAVRYSPAARTACQATSAAGQQRVRERAACARLRCCQRWNAAWPRSPCRRACRPCSSRGAVRCGHARLAEATSPARLGTGSQRSPALLVVLQRRVLPGRQADGARAAAAAGQALHQALPGRHHGRGREVAVRGLQAVEDDPADEPAAVPARSGPAGAEHVCSPHREMGGRSRTRQTCPTARRPRQWWRCTGWTARGCCCSRCGPAGWRWRSCRTQ